MKITSGEKHVINYSAKNYNFIPEGLKFTLTIRH